MRWIVGVCAADVGDFEHHVEKAVVGVVRMLVPRVFGLPEGDADVLHAVAYHCVSDWVSDVRWGGNGRPRGFSRLILQEPLSIYWKCQRTVESSIL